MYQWKFMTQSQVNGTNSTQFKDSVTLVGKLKAAFMCMVALSTTILMCQLMRFQELIQISCLLISNSWLLKFHPRCLALLMIKKASKRTKTKTFTKSVKLKNLNLLTKRISLCSQANMVLAKWTHPPKISLYLLERSPSTSCKKNQRNLAQTSKHL